MSNDLLYKPGKSLKSVGNNEKSLDCREKEVDFPAEDEVADSGDFILIARPSSATVTRRKRHSRKRTRAGRKKSIRIRFSIESPFVIREIENRQRRRKASRPRTMRNALLIV
jgi:hypothetical protein